MTKEEFEYAIKSCGFLIHRGRTYYEESELIKAFEDLGLIHIGLEQQPCDDAISRQDAIKAIDEKAKRIKNEDTLNGLAGAVGILFDLPPVNPQEPKYCDRNICLKNEYNNIDCDECEVTKSQEPTDENLHREREQAYMQGYEDACKKYRQEPKTGHWRHYEGMLICSECGVEFYDDIMEYCGDDVPKCCPDCGIRMVDPQEGVNE